MNYGMFAILMSIRCFVCLLYFFIFIFIYYSPSHVYEWKMKFGHSQKDWKKCQTLLAKKTKTDISLIMVVVFEKDKYYSSRPKENLG